jgi:CheY-like chemotaxis protein
MNFSNIKNSVILIVDDNPTNLGVLFDFLVDSGFQVLVAQDGEDAIAQIDYAPTRSHFVRCTHVWHGWV